MKNLFSKAEQIRYDRHLKLENFGEEAQLLLKNASVVVIGAGGLGSPLLLYLAAAGIGKISIVDFDRVELSNLQRQVLFNTNDIGKNKATCAKEKLLALNPEIIIHDYPVQLTIENVLSILKKYDLVLDGSDNFSTRYLVNDACVILKKPFITASVFKYEGQLSVFNFNNGPTYRCLYPEPPEAGEMPSCSDIGVMGVLPGLMGSLMANECIKLISGVGDVLNGKLLLVDSLAMTFFIHRFEPVPENLTIFEFKSNSIYCEMTVQEISVSELKKLLSNQSAVQFVDVREAWEYEEKNIGAQHISLYDLPEKLNLLVKDKPLVLHCQSGNRSTLGAKLLMENGFTNVYSLQGGINAFLQSE